MSETSDVRLEPGQVVIDAWDLCVDSPDRRTRDAGHRRALVHDFDDGLTVNWAEDYPGGVTVRGVAELHARSGRGMVVHGSVVLEDPATLASGTRVVAGPLSWTRLRSDDGRRLLVEAEGMQNDGLVFTGPVAFEGPVRMTTTIGDRPTAFVASIEDLAREVVLLRSELGALRDRLEALGG